MRAEFGVAITEDKPFLPNARIGSEFEATLMAPLFAFVFEARDLNFPMMPLIRLLGTSLLMVCGALADSTPPLFKADFESQPAGTPYLPEHWADEGLVEPEWSDYFGDHPKGRTTVDDAHPRPGSPQALKVLYPKGAVGPAEGGAQAALRLPPRQEYFASYWVRFGEGFSWGDEYHGGKLPGLGATELSSGGMASDGTDGFTARLMWRKNGKAVLYLYHMDKPHQWGEDFAFVYPDGEPVVFAPGQWYQVTLRTRINTDQNADGLVEAWIDQKPVLKLENLRFVTNGDLVDTLYFSTFHGGNTPEWAPLNDSVIHFDDFKVGTTFESVK